jgi:hypothetical protein
MHLTDNQLALFSLCFGCPEIHATSDCPFQKMRNFTAIEKMEFVANISKKEADELMELHKKCLDNRMRERIISKFGDESSEIDE